MTHHQTLTRNKVVLFGLAIVLFVFSSCIEEETYHRHNHIRGGKWHRDSVMVFVLDSVNFTPTRGHDVSIEISANRAYPYQNIWLYVEQNFSDSVFQGDSLEIKVTDAYGRPSGKGVWRLQQISVPYKALAFKDDTIPRQFRVRHIMSDNPLVGIEKVGVKIQEKP